MLTCALVKFLLNSINTQLVEAPRNYPEGKLLTRLEFMSQNNKELLMQYFIVGKL